jgi:SAM-dependent methyltransferase
MSLDARAVGEYFAREGTVSEWWTPSSGPLAFHYNAELQVLEDRLEIDPAWRVLDVGTGPGRFGALFAGRGCQVVGVDLNPDMLEIARGTAAGLGLTERFEVREASAEDLSSFEDASFDVVCCMELFDHLPDLSRALGEMRRKLRPGGHFLFTYVPNESLYGKLGNLYRWLRARTQPSELMISRTYTSSEARAALARADLTLDRYFGIGVLCVNAQTRLFGDNLVVRALTALARAECQRWPYFETPMLARRGAHVVGFASPGGAGSSEP